MAARDAHMIIGVVDASDRDRSLDTVEELINGGDDELRDDSSAMKSENICSE